MVIVLLCNNFSSKIWLMLLMFLRGIISHDVSTSMASVAASIIGVDYESNDGINFARREKIIDHI